MSLNRYAAKVDSTQPAIVKALRKAGVKVWVIGQPCDLLTFWAGLWLPLEVKSPKGKLTKDQEQMVREHGLPVVHDETEALRAVGVL
jgi:hypothetical protein